MNKIINTFAVIVGMSAMAFAAPQPVQVVETLVSSQYSTRTYAGAKGYSSAVTISSFTITKVDTAFQGVMASTTTGLGNSYQQAEITLQNNDTTDKFCSFMATGLTIANSYKIAVGGVWTFKVGKGVGVYCLNAAGASGTMIVGGVAWK
jgi:hypothetical protein